MSLQLEQNLLPQTLKINKNNIIGNNQEYSKYNFYPLSAISTYQFTDNIMDNKSLENFEDSYDQFKINALKKQITLPKAELFQLVNDDDKFNDKLQYFNRQGYKCIERQQFYQAIVYLNQAEVTLEYAASCGKTIDRALILTTLHNEACVYQRIWELQKSADYIEGIIYNISSFLQGDDRINLCEDILDDKSVQSQKLATVLQSRLKLVCYYLQFCAVNSQLKRHQNSLNAASKSLDILKQICQDEHQYETFTGMRFHNELQKVILLELRNIKDFKDEIANVDKNLERFLNKAKKSISMFQKKIKFPSNLLDHKQIQMLQEFSIGSVMQIYPQVMPQIIDKKWLKEECTPLQKIYKALYISIAHFTMATELRLIASNIYTNDLTARRNSTQYKSSQLHHLISIITVALYVPYETVYFQHILNSHKNHYNIDLSLISQSTLTQELSNTMEQDDEIHLEISSLYRKKNKEQSKDQSNQAKSSVKLTQNNSPSVHDHLKMSKQKYKTSKVSQQNLSVKQKCKMFADSQKTNKTSKGKSLGKSLNKKNKSKKKTESRNKQTLASPISISQKKITSLTTLPDNSKPQIPTSRSKSKNKKKKTPSKPNSQFSNEKKDKIKASNARSEQEYGFTHKSPPNGYLTRTNKPEKEKRSLKSSDRNSQLKKSGTQSRGANDIKYIRQGKSPNPIPKPIK